MICAAYMHPNLQQLKDGELWNIFFEQDTSSANNTEHQRTLGTIFGNRPTITCGHCTPPVSICI